MKNYNALLDIKETEKAIKEVKDFFERELSNELQILRVSAPLFVKTSSGINDSLNGVERPVGFDAKDVFDENLEIVQSLAKWKRIALKRYGFKRGEGLYTDMNAIRRDEDLDNIHSLYVDQWDWEKVIDKSDRNKEYLKDTVKRIYSVFKRTETFVEGIYNELTPILPEEIYFITTQELEDKYPNLTPKEREHEIAKEKGAVFIMEIGDTLKSGTVHDGRAADYDDWSLNGDIILWYETLNIGLELSSMGIRVDEEALEYQLKKRDQLNKLELFYHKKLMDKELPYTIGGGIGQSRICMFFLRKAHIGEVQSSVWSEEEINNSLKNNIFLL